jgi:hypothetical protein
MTENEQQQEAEAMDQQGQAQENERQGAAAEQEQSVPAASPELQAAAERVLDQAREMAAAAMKGSKFNPAHTMAIAGELIAERQRQDDKFGVLRDYPDGTGGTHLEEVRELARLCCQRADADGVVTWRHILNEETAEAEAESDPLKLRAELVQAAALCVAWVEAIDRRLVELAPAQLQQLEALGGAFRRGVDTAFRGRAARHELGQDDVMVFAEKAGKAIDAAVDQGDARGRRAAQARAHAEDGPGRQARARLAAVLRAAGGGPAGPGLKNKRPLLGERRGLPNRGGSNAAHPGYPGMRRVVKNST